MYLVVGFITFGIYIIYVHFKLIQRQQEHFKRMGRFNDDLLKLIVPDDRPPSPPTPLPPGRGSGELL